MKPKQTASDLPRLYQQISIARNITGSLDSALEAEIDAGEFPSENPVSLAHLLRRLVGAIDSRLEWEHLSKLEAFASGGSPPSESSISRVRDRIAAASRAAASFTRVLKFVNGSRASNNPWGIVAQTERLCQTLNAGARVIIRPRWAYNYSYVSISADLKRIALDAKWFDSNLHRALSTYIERAPNFFSLAFPPTAAGNALHMAIWAHEIGHFIDNIEGEAKTSNPSDFLSSLIIKDLEFEIDQDSFKQLVEEEGIEVSDPDTLDKFAEKISAPIAERMQIWSREIFSDIFSMHLFGPAALFALVEFGHSVSHGLDVLASRWHPTFRIRLSILLDQYDSWLSGSHGWLDGLPSAHAEAYDQEIQYLRDLIESPIDEGLLLQGDEEKSTSKIVHALLAEKANEVVQHLVTEIERIKKTSPGCFLHPTDLVHLAKMTERIANSLPPSIDPASSESSEPLPSSPRHLALILNAGWLHWLKIRQAAAGPDLSTQQIASDSYQDANSLTMKAVEIAEAVEWFSSRQPHSREVDRSIESNPVNSQELPETGNGMSIPFAGWLSRRQIIRLIETEDLVVMPLLNPGLQIGKSSIDLRLGNDFIETKLPAITQLDPVDLEIGSSATQFQSKVYVPFGKPYVLHPSQFVLSSTLEFLMLPNNLMGLVLGRSSWGRLGLVIATASKVDPGWRGCVTLELTNLGNAPILLYPGARIGQVSLAPVG